MDTGASKSCIRGELARDLPESHILFKSISANARAAEGQNQKIIGKVTTQVKFKDTNNKYNPYI